jgi:hypothetical protein
MKKHAVVEGDLEVVEHALRSHEIWHTGVVHVEAHLPDRVDVRPAERKVLESPGQVVISSRIANIGAHVGGDLGLSVDRRGVGLAVAHASVIKDVQSVLTLVKEEVVGSLTETSRKWWRGSISFMVNYCWRAVVVCWRSSGLEVVRTMSST